MGCWGITASESDAGLDALAAIRTQIQKDGTLKLEDILAEADIYNAAFSGDPLAVDHIEFRRFKGRSNLVFDHLGTGAVADGLAPLL